MTSMIAWPLLWSTPTFVIGAVFYGFFGRTLDAVLILIITLLNTALELSDDIGFSLRNFTLTVLIGLLSVAIILQAFRSIRTTATSTKWEGHGRVLLFPSMTSHSRMFPKRHSFSYSYLVVGIPVRWQGVVSGMVSSGVSQSQSLFSWFLLQQGPHKGWYDIDAADYLERGNRELGLRGKLDAYLQSQGVDPELYPHAYLVTAARFLGYHFNPVSFWYLYTADMTLAAMILEVNNTFDERRMYFLTPGTTGSEMEIKDGEDGVSAASSQDTRESTSVNPDSSSTFTQTWPKDFHVSPFNSRKGSYSLTANDPLKALAEGKDPITNTITLKSSKGYGKLVARLSTVGQPLDPSTMTMLQKASFLATWWWVGFVTFPRIVREAGALFFRKQLHVWYRPEPLKESMGRNADPTERRLEAVFRDYLRYMVEQSHATIIVKYVPSGVSKASEELMLSPLAKNGGVEAEEVEFKVLTPVFYSRFVCYAHDLEAIFSELRENCTIWVSRPDLLPKLLFQKPSAHLKTSSYVDFAYFKAIQSLRRRPGRIERPMTSSAPAPQLKSTTMDIRDFRLSAMDAYVLNKASSETKRAYRSLVLKLFIADRVTLGSVTLLEVVLLLIHGFMAWSVSAALLQAITQVGASD